MVILTALTIDFAVDGKLFENSKKTVGEANNKLGDEQNRVNNMLNEWDDLEIGISGDTTIIVNPGDKANTTTEYEDSNGDIAVIPGGFTVSGLPEESKIDDGLVIYLIPDGETVDWENPSEVANAQKTYDQFVWIPISHTQINNMYICQAKTTSNGNCNIQLVNGEVKCTVHNSTQMAGRLYATNTGEEFEQGYTEVYTANTGLREPDVVDDDIQGYGFDPLNTILNPTTINSATEFKEYLQLEYNEVVKSVYENQGFYIGRYETSNMVDENTNSTVKSVAGTTTGISGVSWYRMYAQQKKYAENKGLTSVKSTMMQGATYDQVIKFIEKGTTYILEGNVDEWTTEVCSQWINTRVTRSKQNNYTVRSYKDYPSDTWSDVGTRMLLYVNL